MSEEACDASVLKLQRKRERKRCEEAGEASALAGGKRSLWGENGSTQAALLE